MNSPLNKKSYVDPTSGMVKWDGPNIPCLDLCNGDTVNEVVYKLATKVCTLVDEHKDLATLDYSCIIDLCNNSNCAALSDPERVSLKGIFQILLDNDCKLKDLIATLQNSVNNISSNLNFELDLKCIEGALISICKSNINYTLNDILQAMINTICDNDSVLLQLMNDTGTLNNNVQSLTESVQSSVYEEPYLSNACIADGNSLIHHEFTDALANKVCDVSSLVGTDAEVESALASSPSTNPNNNLAQNEYNQWQIISSLMQRITDLENGCCNHNCESISLGYSVDYILESNTYHIIFSYGTGTNIPPYFGDCGSSITISDEHGNYLLTNITLSNSLELNIVGTGIDETTVRTVTFQSCLTDYEITCNQTITQTINP